LDVQEFYNRVLALIKANQATLVNFTGVTLAERRRMSAETIAATKQGYHSITKTIDN
jgi:hypothetical protein